MKNIKITDCIGCPYLLHEIEDDYIWADTYWYCGKKGKFLGKTIDEIPTVIPDWCPLEDVYQINWSEYDMHKSVEG